MVGINLLARYDAHPLPQLLLWLHMLLHAPPPPSPPPAQPQPSTNTSSHAAPGPHSHQHQHQHHQHQQEASGQCTTAAPALAVACRTVYPLVRPAVQRWVASYNAAVAEAADREAAGAAVAGAGGEGGGGDGGGGDGGGGGGELTSPPLLFFEIALAVLQVRVHLHTAPTGRRGRTGTKGLWVQLTNVGFGRWGGAQLPVWCISDLRVGGSGGGGGGGAGGGIFLSHAIADATSGVRDAAGTPSRDSCHNG